MLNFICSDLRVRCVKDMSVQPSVTLMQLNTLLIRINTQANGPVQNGD